MRRTTRGCTPPKMGTITPVLRPALPSAPRYMNRMAVVLCIFLLLPRSVPSLPKSAALLDRLHEDKMAVRQLVVVDGYGTYCGTRKLGRKFARKRYSTNGSVDPAPRYLESVPLCKKSDKAVSETKKASAVHANSQLQIVCGAKSGSCIWGTPAGRKRCMELLLVALACFCLVENGNQTSGAAFLCSPAQRMHPNKDSRRGPAKQLTAAAESRKGRWFLSSGTGDRGAAA
jgi:hypothetical protein